MTRLADVDLSLKLSKAEEAEQLAAAQRRLLELRLTLGGQIGDGRLGPPVCVLFEGWDASARRGHPPARRAARPPPRAGGQLQCADRRREAPPLPVPLRPVLPGWGGMAVMDRTWYGRVLVERVERFATKEQWQRAYDEIVAHERTLAAEGMVFIKFWLHISDEERLAPVRRRRAGPAQVLEADRRGLAQPRAGGPTTRRPWRTCSSAPTTRPAGGTSSPASPSASPGST